MNKEEKKAILKDPEFQTELLIAEIQEKICEILKPRFSVSVPITQDLSDDIAVLEKAFPGHTKSELLRKAVEIAAKKIFDDALAESAKVSS